MNLRTKQRLFDALKACHAIESFVAQRTFADYEKIYWCGLLLNVSLKLWAKHCIKLKC